MSQAEQPAEDRRGQPPSSASSPKHSRRRVRKRRYHVPPEALGLDYYHVPTIVCLETSSRLETPKSPITESPDRATTRAQANAAEIAEAEFRSEEEKKLQVSRRALWLCIAILLLILFQKPIGWLLDQAVSAWPSINGF